MVKALIGSSGFVGGVLLRQTMFDDLFRSTNISSIAGKNYDTVVCAGAPAQKWIANRAPEADAANIQNLVDNLRAVRCERFVLISTVDVFARPVDVDEQTTVVETGLHAYGRNRRALETFVERQFPNHLIVRLPGLVGPGLRKNVIFDLLNNNNLSAVDSRAVYQFYPMVNLARDVGTAVENGLRLIHLTSEPVSVAEIAEQGFNRTFANRLAGEPAVYDFRSRHAAAFGGQGSYQYSKRESLLAIRTYAQSEARAAAMGASKA